MQKKIVVHMYLKNGKAVTGFDGKELLEDGDVMSIAQHYSNNGADELLIFDLSDDDADHEQSLNLIRQISRVIDIPMSGGGHIKNLEDVKKLLYAGCQQVFLNYAKAANIELTEEVSKRFGKEKIAICTDSFAQLQANKARVNEYTSAVKQTAVCCEQANTECSHGTAGTVYGNGTDRIINLCDAVKEINGYTQQDTCK